MICKSPINLPAGQVIACRKCKYCKGARVNQITGVACAEAYTSKFSTVITLTYGGGDHERATVLHYSDVQKALKRMRFDGLTCRYLIVGEYGAHRMRAHWHGILFHDQPIDLVKKTRTDWGYWPHGHVYAEQSNYEAIRYCLKYVLKHEGTKSLKRQSLRPALGEKYFDQDIKRRVDQGLPPLSFTYSVPGIKSRNGKKVKFGMNPSLRHRYMTKFLQAWDQAGKKSPPNEFCQEYIDTQSGDY